MTTAMRYGNRPLRRGNQPARGRACCCAATCPCGFPDGVPLKLSLCIFRPDGLGGVALCDGSPLVLDLIPAAELDGFGELYAVPTPCVWVTDPPIGAPCASATAHDQTWLFTCSGDPASLQAYNWAPYPTPWYIDGFLRREDILDGDGVLAAMRFCLDIGTNGGLIDAFCGESLGCQYVPIVHRADWSVEDCWDEWAAWLTCGA